MARPQRRMVPPAIAWVNLSSLLNLTTWTPLTANRTITIIVEIVVIPKTAVTRSIPNRLSSAAGYISNGINGSQGPKTNMVNSTQGVILTGAFASSWI